MSKADWGSRMDDRFCPICKKKILPEQADPSPCLPFCSERCKLVDLGRWLDGMYLIPGQAQDHDPQDPREN